MSRLLAVALLTTALGCHNKYDDGQEPYPPCRGNCEPNWYIEDAALPEPMEAGRIVDAGPLSEAGIAADTAPVPVNEAGIPLAGDAGQTACSALLDGDKLCLVCVMAGKEVYRECKPASQTCQTKTTATELCIECQGTTGQVVLKLCAPISQTCQAEQFQGKLCLICRDAAGNKLGETCPP